jgi:hypothetical protein
MGGYNNLCKWNNSNINSNTVSMIKGIIDMLKISEFVGVSENIEIAKGKHELKDTIKGIWKQAFRELKVKRNGRKKGN